MRGYFIVSIAFMAMTTGPSQGQEVTLLSLGKLGGLSCFVWQSTTDRREDGENWLVGYWTALNALAAKAGRPQSDLDRAGIIAEVTRTCARNDSQVFAKAASDTFQELTAGAGAKRP
jgi:hypothetical protein